jgi:hypothetical protein
VVQCFCIKKGEVALTFKTLPTPQKAREALQAILQIRIMQLEGGRTANGCNS